jgi:hypothetical protein
MARSFRTSVSVVPPSRSTMVGKVMMSPLSHEVWLLAEFSELGPTTTTTGSRLTSTRNEGIPLLPDRPPCLLSFGIGPASLPPSLLLRTQHGWEPSVGRYTFAPRRTIARRPVLARISKRLAPCLSQLRTPSRRRRPPRAPPTCDWITCEFPRLHRPRPGSYCGLLYRWCARCRLTSDRHTTYSIGSANLLLSTQRRPSCSGENIGLLPSEAAAARRCRRRRRLRRRPTSTDSSLGSFSPR